MKVAVAGGGLAGLAASLDLADAGYDVTLSRPGRRSAAWCRRFPHEPATRLRHPTTASTSRSAAAPSTSVSSGRTDKPRGSPPAAEPCRSSTSDAGSPCSEPARPLSSATAISRSVTASAWRGSRAGSPGWSLPNTTARRSGWLQRRLGSTQVAIDRFWDVFIRPGLNLPGDQASASLGLFTVQTALLGPREASDLLLPVAPLGEMHGDAAGRALEEAGATVMLRARVASLEEDEVVLADGERVLADLTVVASPRPESAALLGEPAPELGDSPIVSVHLLFDRQLLAPPLAALLDSPAHWVFDRGRLDGSRTEARAVPHRGGKRGPWSSPRRAAGSWSSSWRARSPTDSAGLSCCGPVCEP